MSLNASTYDDLLELAENLNDDSEHEAQEVTDYLDGVNDALRKLEASEDTAIGILAKAQDWLGDGRIDEDEYDQITSYVDDIRDRLSDARQEILNVAK